MWPDHLAVLVSSLWDLCFSLQGHFSHRLRDQLWHIWVELHVSGSTDRAIYTWHWSKTRLKESSPASWSLVSHCEEQGFEQLLHRGVKTHRLAWSLQYKISNRRQCHKTLPEWQNDKLCVIQHVSWDIHHRTWHSIVDSPKPPIRIFLFFVTQ